MLFLPSSVSSPLEISKGCGQSVSQLAHLSPFVLQAYTCPPRFSRCSVAQSCCHICWQGCGFHCKELPQALSCKAVVLTRCKGLPSEPFCVISAFFSPSMCLSCITVFGLSNHYLQEFLASSSSLCVFTISRYFFIPQALEF